MACRRFVRLAALLVAVGAASSLALTASPAKADSSCAGTWQVVPSYDVPQQSGQQDLDSLNGMAAVSSTDQWAVGTWEQYPNAYHFHTLVEHWDGSSNGWTVVPSIDPPVLNSYLRGVAAAGPNDVWAVGGTDPGTSPYHSLVEHWDGSAWSIAFPASFQGVLYAVAALGPNDVWAVGTEDYPGRGLIEHWDGTTWTATHTRFAAVLRGISAIGPNQIWAVGQRYGRFDPYGDTTLTMRFNGKAWKEIQSPNPLSGISTDQNWLTAVSAVAAKDVWAVGRYGNHDGGPFDQTLIEHWNGSRWTVVPSPDPGGSSYDDDLWGVAAVASHDAWAVGAVGFFGDTPVSTPLALHWDGSQWTQVALPSGAGELFATAPEPGGAGISAVGDTLKPAQPNDFLGTLAEHVCPG